MSSAEILRMIYQGRFLHGNVTLAALGLPTGKTTVMHLVPRESLPEPNSQGMSLPPTTFVAGDWKKGLGYFKSINIFAFACQKVEHIICKGRVAKTFLTRIYFGRYRGIFFLSMFIKK